VGLSACSARVSRHRRHTNIFPPLRLHGIHALREQRCLHARGRNNNNISSHGGNRRAAEGMGVNITIYYARRPYKVSVAPWRCYAPYPVSNSRHKQRARCYYLRHSSTMGVRTLPSTVFATIFSGWAGCYHGSTRHSAKTKPLSASQHMPASWGMHAAGGTYCNTWHSHLAGLHAAGGCLPSWRPSPPGWLPAGPSETACEPTLGCRNNDICGSAKRKRIQRGVAIVLGMGEQRRASALYDSYLPLSITAPANCCGASMAFRHRFSTLCRTASPMTPASRQRCRLTRAGNAAARHLLPPIFLTRWRWTSPAGQGTASTATAPPSFLFSSLPAVPPPLSSGMSCSTIASTPRHPSTAYAPPSTFASARSST